MYLYNSINTSSYTTSTTNLYNKDLHTRRALHHHGGFAPALVPTLFENEALQGAVQH
jgi:hypothetical protein